MSTMSIFKGLTGKAISEVTEPSPSAKLDEGFAVQLPAGVDPQKALDQASSFGAPAAAAGIMGAGAYLKNEIGSRVIDKGIGLATSAAGKVASMVRGPRGGGNPFNKPINAILRQRRQDQLAQQPATEANLVPSGTSPSPDDPSGEAHGVGKRTEAANPAPPPTMKVSPSSVLKNVSKSTSAMTKSLSATTAQTTAAVTGSLQPKVTPAAPAPAKREQTDEGLKLIHTDSKGNRSAKVYRDHEYNEYRVKHFTDGKHHKKADYHTDDKLDAMSTADHWLHGTANEEGEPRSPRGSWQKSERLEDPFAEAERLVQERMDGEVDEISRRDFASPGSALRRAHKHNPRNQPCPTCKEPNKLTPKDVKLRLQCDDCADREEGAY